MGGRESEREREREGDSPLYVALARLTAAKVFAWFCGARHPWMASNSCTCLFNTCMLKLMMLILCVPSKEKFRNYIRTHARVIKKIRGGKIRSK